MARTSKVRKERKKQYYGIAEWYGQRFANLSNDQRRILAGTSNTKMACPFFNQVPALGPKNGKLNCNKAGGVCSLRNFHPAQKAGDDITFGPITATCPNRFLESGTIVRHIGMELLGTTNPLFAKEIPFLRRPKSLLAAEATAETEAEIAEETEAEGVVDPGQEDVGRIDLVFVHPDNEEKWCAVEMQAVYFSGGKMARDYDEIMKFSGNGIPMPGAARRPDFRSSGPKRLMPQLMIKVPTLRRWGKKMAVVIDKPFFDAMDSMDTVEHISNCDIVWIVVSFDETVEVGKAVLKIEDTIYTTLEDAVKGLTAGQPTTLPEFETKLEGKLAEAFPVRPQIATDSSDLATESVPMGLSED